MEFVLAFDVEHSGHEIIAIGASAVKTDNYKTFDLIESYFCGIYDENLTKFSERCYDEFWSKNLSILETLKYKGIYETKEDRERELITGFQKFRAEMEEMAAYHKKKLVLTSDNNVFDGGIVNELIKKYLKCEPIPFTASTQEYSSFFETFSQQKGLLSVVDSNFKSDWGLSNRIFELYDIDKSKIKYNHDHNSVNDAYTIAVDQLILFGIRDGKIKLK